MWIFNVSSGMQQTIVHHADPVSGHLHCRWSFLDVLINNDCSLDYLYDFSLLPVISKQQNALFNELFAYDDIF